MSTDHQIEEEIQAKGKTAPRVTPSDIEASIVSEYYFTAMEGVEGTDPKATVYGQWEEEFPDVLGTLTFCVLVLKNGFMVTGESSCASPDNFGFESGRKVARANAIQKLWPLMEYELKSKLSD